MGQSLIAPEPLPPGRIVDKRADSVITIEERGGRMIHTLTERGLTAEYPIRYQIGSHFMARTYLVQIGDYLFESPATWFKRYGWDLSPGYASKRFIGFDRPIEQQCLFCHANAARFSDSDHHRLKNPQTRLTAISCDRCHGPSAAHVQHPTANNIVNPAKLGGRARDSICEQCHLEGAVRVLNPGKNWLDFHSGQPTEDTFATYLLTGGNSKNVVAVSQTEELAQSRCFRESGGKLWCGTCHNPHAKVVNRQREIRAICSSCHTTLLADHPPHPKECTSCHMPTSATTDIPHAARTDHRILSRPSEAAALSQSGPPKVTVWHQPPANVRQRDFDVAEVLIGYSKNVLAIASDGLRRLQTLPASQKHNDAVVLSYLEGYSLEQHKLKQAIRFGRRTVALRPRSAKAAMDLGIVLKQSGDLAEAERQFLRAIDLDPSLRQAYAELAMLYQGEGKTREITETIDRFLKWNPKDIGFRLQKARAAQ